MEKVFEIYPVPGARDEMRSPAADAPLGEGEVLEADPPRRPVQTMRALRSDEVRSEGTSRVTSEIQPVADSCRLTVVQTSCARVRTTSSPAAGR